MLTCDFSLAWEHLLPSDILSLGQHPPAKGSPCVHNCPWPGIRLVAPDVSGASRGRCPAQSLAREASHLPSLQTSQAQASRQLSGPAQPWPGHTHALSPSHRGLLRAQGTTWLVLRGDPAIKSRPAWCEQGADRTRVKRCSKPGGWGTGILDRPPLSTAAGHTTQVYAFQVSLGLPNHARSLASLLFCIDLEPRNRLTHPRSHSKKPEELALDPRVLCCL